MKSTFLAAFWLVSSGLAFSGELDGKELIIDDSKIEPWESTWFDFESGYTWKVRNNTPLNYEIVPTQFTVRTRSQWGHRFPDESHLVLRHSLSLLTSYFADGPEQYYFGISLGPVFEYYPASMPKWICYFSVGGGVGLTDSFGGEAGALGQDFTLNWYAQLGLRYQVFEDVMIFAGPYFVHHSNGGMTDPNPGVDALGFTIGISKRF